MNKTETRRIINLLRKLAKGTVFSCTFTKRSTGEEREMVCRLGVRRGVKGVGMTYEPDSKGLITVWDMQKQQYRMIPVEGIKRIKIRGEEYRFDDK